MPHTDKPAQNLANASPRRRFKLMRKTLGASESGATALGYVLALAAAVMFASSLAGSPRTETPSKVMHGDMDGPPSE